MGGTGRVTASIPRSPNGVFALLSDIDCLHESNAHITKVLDRPDTSSPALSGWSR
jgi:hypothetical protein